MWQPAVSLADMLPPCRPPKFVRQPGVLTLQPEVGPDSVNYPAVFCAPGGSLPSTFDVVLNTSGYPVDLIDCELPGGAQHLSTMAS